MKQSPYPMPCNNDSHTEVDLDVFRELLESRRVELLEDDALGRDAAGTVELDQTRQGRLSRMDAMH